MKTIQIIAGFALASLTLGAIADVGAAANANVESATPAAKVNAVTGAEVVRGLQSLTPEQVDRVLSKVDKFDANTKSQFKNALLHPDPFIIGLLTTAADRIAPESRQQLAAEIAKVKAGK
ncbi:MAG TPA: hypothetical protein VFW68_04800 [Rhodocyclaceae bacterium]|nr:hypothetical protein [Rhodocyclaceae bacterium]